MTATELLHMAAVQGRDFLVVGGHAVNAHGYPRATYDVDLLVRERDRAAWRSAVESLGYRCFRDVPAFVQFSPPERNLAPLDLMVVTEETFAKLWAGRVYRSVGGVELPFPKVEHVIAMKLFAARSPDRHDAEKDWWDVLKLIELCNVDVRAAEFREIVERYGRPGFYQRILAHFGAPP
jgi:hypothetical protein